VWCDAALVYKSVDFTCSSTPPRAALVAASPLCSLDAVRQ